MVHSVPRSSLIRGSRFHLLAVGVAALLAACGGGGGSGGEDIPDVPVTPAPSFSSPTVSPSAATWNTSGVRFVVSGGANLEGNTFTAVLDDHACTSAAVDPQDATKLIVTCDTPDGGSLSRVDLEVVSGERTVATVEVSMSWTPATGPVSFVPAASVFSTATWWQLEAKVYVSGGVNLPGHELTAAIRGVPCSEVKVSSNDDTRLELTCDTPPGGGSTIGRLIIAEGTAIKADFELDLDECADLPAPAAGVALPRLCDADDGSYAAEDEWGVGGIWWATLGDARILVEPPGYRVSGQFLSWEPGLQAAAGTLNVTGDYLLGAGTLTLEGERIRLSQVETLSGSGTLAPFDHITGPTGAGLGFSQYSIANAMGVSQANLVGTWGEVGSAVRLTVTNTGSFDGTTSGADFGACTIKGTLTQVAAGRNLFDMTLTPTTSTTCSIDGVSSPYSGLAAIEVVNTGTETNPVYEYALTFVAGVKGRSYISGGGVLQ